ncbi:MAG: hypothetical protein MSS80_08185 [Mollicutes bacterium]|nr:hypothetical protein [Mollicutes bacterium]
MERLVNYRKPKRLIEKINNGECGEYIKFQGIEMQLVPVFWNNTYCYVDLKNDDNYINLNENKKVTLFCVNDFYIEK